MAESRASGSSSGSAGSDEGDEAAGGSVPCSFGGGSKCTLSEREGSADAGEVGLGGYDAASSKLIPRRCPDLESSRGRPFPPMRSDRLESDADGDRKREVVGEGPTLKDSKGSSPDKVRSGVCRVGLKFQEPIESLSCAESLRPATVIGAVSSHHRRFAFTWPRTHVGVVGLAGEASRQVRPRQGMTSSSLCERMDVREAFRLWGWSGGRQVTTSARKDVTRRHDEQGFTAAQDPSADSCQPWPSSLCCICTCRLRGPAPADRP